MTKKLKSGSMVPKFGIPLKMTKNHRAALVLKATEMFFDL